MRLPIDFLAMPDSNHGDGGRRIIDVINDSIVSGSNAPGSLSVFHFLATWRARVVPKRQQSRFNLFKRMGRESLQVLFEPGAGQLPGNALAIASNFGQGLFERYASLPGSPRFVVCTDVFQIFQLLEDLFVFLDADDDGNFFAALIHNELAFLLPSRKESNPNDLVMLKSATRRQRKPP